MGAEAEGRGTWGRPQAGLSGVSGKPRAAEDGFRRGLGRRLGEPGEAALEWNLRGVEEVERARGGVAMAGGWGVSRGSGREGVGDWGRRGLGRTGARRCWKAGPREGAEGAPPERAAGGGDALGWAVGRGTGGAGPGRGYRGAGGRTGLGPGRQLAQGGRW